MSSTLKISGASPTFSLADIQEKLGSTPAKNELTSALGGQDKGKTFGDLLREKIAEVNADQKVGDQMGANLATGKAENLHETMLSVSHAELSFKLMVQLRNRALEAYQEVMRMPV